MPYIYLPEYLLILDVVTELQSYAFCRRSFLFHIVKVNILQGGFGIFFRQYLSRLRPRTLIEKVADAYELWMCIRLPETHLMSEVFHPRVQHPVLLDHRMESVILCCVDETALGNGEVCVLVRVSTGGGGWREGERKTNNHASQYP